MSSETPKLDSAIYDELVYIVVEGRKIENRQHLTKFELKIIDDLRPRKIKYGRKISVRGKQFEIFHDLFNKLRVISSG